MYRADLTPNQIDALESILGHVLSIDELAHYNSEHSDEYGYFLLPDKAQIGGRHLLLLYSACWSRGIWHYLAHYRPDVVERYYPVIILDFALVLSVIRDKRFPVPLFVEAAWRKADAVLFTPIGESYGPFSSEHLLRMVKPDCKTVAFTGPNQGCWWPVCELVGEHGAINLFNEGLNPDQVIDRFRDKKFDPKFDLRFAEQMAFLKGKQSFGSIRLTEFIQAHYRTHKLFFTFNHPTYNVLAFCADCALALMGMIPMGDEHSLSLPLDSISLGDIYPETHYEFEHYNLRYPMRYTAGSEAFYERKIHEAYARWKSNSA